MSITFELPNFASCGKNQLTEVASDGQPDNDRSYECVPTSIASGMQFLTGKPYDGDEIRDAVYGPNYVGGTAASAFVAYCAARGVDLTPFNGTQAQLVAEIHAQLHQGHPVIVTMPSQWGVAPPDPVHPVGWTHVGIMYGDGPGELECMNPWIWPQLHLGDDAYWAARLCFGQIWIMSSKAGQRAMGIPQGWTDDGTTLTAPKADGTPGGFVCVRGMRDHVLNWPGGWPNWDIPLMNEAAANPVELANPSLGAGVIQIFRSGQRTWTSTRGVFDTWTGQELLAVKASLASAQKAASDAQATAAAAQQTASAAQQAASQAQAALVSAQGQRDALSAQLATANGKIAAAKTALG